jgi:hypothetical protein
VDRVPTHPVKLVPGTKDEEHSRCSAVFSGVPCGRPALDPIHTVIKVTRVRGVARPSKYG